MSSKETSGWASWYEPKLSAQKKKKKDDTRQKGKEQEEALVRVHFFLVWYVLFCVLYSRNIKKIPAP